MLTGVQALHTRKQLLEEYILSGMDAVSFLSLAHEPCIHMGLHAAVGAGQSDLV